MVFGEIHREEAPAVGEPADATVQELAGIAPPCECGAEATQQIDGTDYCDACASRVKSEGDSNESSLRADSAVDLFAGAGGLSWGLVEALKEVAEV